MKRIISVLAVALSLAAVFSCTKDKNPQDEGKNGVTVYGEFTAFSNAVYLNPYEDEYVLSFSDAALDPHSGYSQGGHPWFYIMTNKFNGSSDVADVDAFYYCAEYSMSAVPTSVTKVLPEVDNVPLGYGPVNITEIDFKVTGTYGKDCTVTVKAKAKDFEFNYSGPISFINYEIPEEAR